MQIIQACKIAAIYLSIISINANAALINANSCSRADVQSAIGVASPGDTIALKRCNDSWASSITIAKQNLTIKGNGIGSTIIQGGTKSILLSGETANNLRITGIEFRSGTQLIYAGYTGTPRQAVKNLRVDHCKFVGVNAVIETQGAVKGVFDHNIFQDSYGGRIYGSNDAAVRAPYPLGTSDALFYEDNTINVTGSEFSPSHFIASNSHSKYVIRHNIFNYQKSLWDIVDAHGACEVKGRGSATWEIYENVFNVVPSINRIIHLRGGQGVVFNNVFQGYTPSKPITVTDYAVCNGPCTQSCTTYPCPDLINHAYFWNNKIGSKSVDPVNACTAMLQLNRDYYTVQMPNYEPYTYPHPLTQEEDPVFNKYIGTRNMNYNADISIHHVNFNQTTRFVYQLNLSALVSLSVYTMDGVLVETLFNSRSQPGGHELTWNGQNLPSGNYLLQIQINGKKVKDYLFTK